MTVRYEKNDDIVMNLIASGTLTGYPSAYLLFMNIILGFFIQSAYQLLPGIEWYFVHFALAQIVSVAVIIYVFLREYEKSQHKIIFLFLASILIFITNFIIVPQFTYISFLLTASGYLFILYQVRKKYTFDKKIWIGIALVTWGSWVRIEVFILIGIIILPLFIATKNYKLFVKVYSWTIICVFISWLVNYWIYTSNKEWKETYKIFYDKSLHKLSYGDNAYINLDKNIIDNAIKNTHNKYPYKLVINEVIFSTQLKIKDVQEMSALIKSHLFSKSHIKYFYTIVIDNKKYISIIFLIGTIFILGTVVQKEYKNSIAGLSFILFLLLMWFLVTGQLILKDRIILGSMFSILIFSFYTISYYSDFSKKLIKYTVFLVAIYTIIISITVKRYMVYYYPSILDKMYKENIQYISDKNTYAYNFFKDDFIVGAPVWKISKELKNKKIIFMGWIAPTPHMKYQIKKYFPDYEIKNTWIQPVYEEVIPKYNVILWGHIPPILKEYLEKEYNISVSESKKCKACYEFSIQK